MRCNVFSLLFLTHIHNKIIELTNNTIREKLEIDETKLLSTATTHFPASKTEKISPAKELFSTPKNVSLNEISTNISDHKSSDKRKLNRLLELHQAKVYYLLTTLQRDCINMRSIRKQIDNHNKGVSQQHQQEDWLYTTLLQKNLSKEFYLLALNL